MRWFNPEYSMHSYKSIIKWQKTQNRKLIKASDKVVEMSKVVIFQESTNWKRLYHQPQQRRYQQLLPKVDRRLGSPKKHILSSVEPHTPAMGFVCKPPDVSVDNSVIIYPKQSSSRKKSCHGVSRELQNTLERSRKSPEHSQSNRKEYDWKMIFLWTEGGGSIGTLWISYGILWRPSIITILVRQQKYFYV